MASTKGRWEEPRGRDSPHAADSVRRLPDLGIYDRETIHKILDAGFVCHLGFSVDGHPHVIPNAYGQEGDVLYVHGSPASRGLKVLRTGAPVYVTVTHLDGLVLARSVFNHSMNYRSVMILGKASEIADPEDKQKALRCISEHLVPGRSDDAREPTDRELAATALFAVPILEASARVRKGPPSDAVADYALHVWAGVVPYDWKPGPLSPIRSWPRPSSCPVISHDLWTVTAILRHPQHERTS